MLRIALLATLALAACSDTLPAFDAQAPSDAQVPSDAGESQYCERYQHAPAPCWNEECNQGTRVCGAEKECQNWDDCIPYADPDAAPSPCFQCRYRNWCDCR